MFKKLLCATALSGFVIAAQAADTYEFDPTHTFPRFSISHLGFSTFRARFDKTTGSATLDTAKKSGSVEATIEVASISTGVDKLNEHLKAPDFFDAAKFPTISFKGTQFKFEGDKPVEVTGELSMHGVTKPVTLKFTSFNCGQHPMMKIAVCGADLETTVKRSDFGISYAVPMVGDEVSILIEVEARKK
ncbi:Polyisoprenoid-binding protein YceI [Solimonas aquatica]|uniref:Polyisoprenoid-binding protein YceI n=1 Tax=Solimonas aquatica TaxID=489703 RepID=A0A1H9KRA7_9GAMM|nr:YceI family protein [Solimonas aquatica]SER01642.1 Polyisoprenoid-binding protein YceI [Solimonas aquatica]